MVAEGAAAFGEKGVEVVERLEVAVGDGFVDERPEVLGGLEFRRVGWQVDEPDASGTARFGSVCQPAPSSRRTMIRSRPAPVSRAKPASIISKSRLSMPSERYQTVSPLSGATKAVT